MGARANVIIKSGTEQVVLYSHWGGRDVVTQVKEALARKARWDDFQYLTRIVFCQMLDDLTGETGFGITTTIHDNEFPVTTINVDDQTVEVEDGKTLSFEEFIR